MDSDDYAQGAVVGRYRSTGDDTCDMETRVVLGMAGKDRADLAGEGRSAAFVFGAGAHGMNTTSRIARRSRRLTTVVAALGLSLALLINGPPAASAATYTYFNSGAQDTVWYYSGGVGGTYITGGSVDLGYVWDVKLQTLDVVNVIVFYSSTGTSWTSFTHPAKPRGANQVQSRCRFQTGYPGGLSGTLSMTCKLYS